MTPDTSGPASSPPFAWYDRETSCWRTSQGTFLSGSDEFSATWPKSGMTRAGYAYELPTPALPTAEPASSSSLPTPRATRGGSGTETMYALGGQRTDAGRTQGEVLLPTPVADHSRGLPQPGTDYASLPNAVISLLPTPSASDTSKHSGQPPELRIDRGHSTRLTDVTEHLEAWTTRLLPTPRATDGEKGGPNQRGSSGDLMLPSAVVRLLPTPDANMGNGGRTRSAEALARGDMQTNLNDLPRLLPRGGPTSPRSDGGSTSSGDELPGQLSLDDPASD